MESVSTIYHCTWLRKCVFMVLSSKPARTVFQVLKNLVVHGRVSSTDGKVLRWIHAATFATAVGSESAYSWFDPVKVARMLTCLYGKTVFPGVEKPFCLW